MKKLIPLLIVLAFISGGLYYQDELIDLFIGQNNNQTSSNSSGPPSLPAINFGNTEESQPKVTEDEIETEPSVETEQTIDEPVETDEDLDLSALDDLDNLSEEQSDSNDLSTDNDELQTSGPPSMPAFNFGPPAEIAPIEVVSEEIEAEVENQKIKTPDIQPQEFKNSFLKFSYPINVTVQSVSLSSLDLNSIENKLLNLSYFNNPDRLSVQEFVADSSNVTDFFKTLAPEKLEMENVDEAFVIIDVALSTKFYVIKSDNIIVLIELDIDRNYEFIEQIIIPSIESQIL